MKRILKLAFVFCAVFAAACFFGCKGKKSSGGDITLTVWESRNGPDEFIRQAGERYTELHPNIKIKYVNVELGDSVNQIALDGPAGKGPDLFAAPHDRLGSLVTGGHVLATRNPDEVRKIAFENCANALTYDGTMYGYPVSAETYALFYNKKLVSEDKVPKTWEELAAFAKDFNAGNPGKRGFVMDVGSAYYTVIFTTENGNRLFGKDGSDGEKTYINTPDAVNGMKFFQSLRSALDVPASDLDTATVDGAFQSGSAAMHITGLWNVVQFQKAGIDFGVAHLPSLPGDTTPAANFSGTRAMFVSAYSDHPEEANDFAFFLMSDEMQQLRFGLTQAAPSTDVPVQSPYMAGFMEQLKYSFPMPSIPQMTLFWEAMNSASKNIWDGADVQSELDACDRTILGK